MKDEEIFDILDGIASQETINRHQHLLSESLEYQQLFQDYAQTHHLLMDMPLEKTAVNFTDKLMDKWEVSQELALVKKPSKLPYYFLITMGILLLISVVIMLSSGIRAAVTMDFTSIVKLIQHKGFINSLLIINILIILKYIDKRILKPYFQKHYQIGA